MSENQLTLDIGLKLPDFSDPALNRLMVCCQLDASEDLLEKYRAEDFAGDIQYQDEHWFRLIVDVARRRDDDDKGRIHFHLDAVRR